MSEKYNISTVTGDSWIRAKRIVIENEYGVYPQVKFVEEQIVNLLNGSQIKQDIGTLEVNSDENAMSTVIPVMDPSTGEPTGESILYQDAYAAIYSAYIYFANKRDGGEGA